jgi:hypothetical protein
MSRFEREKISKRVLTVSQVFATLAGVGILIIGLQLFQKLPVSIYSIYNILIQSFFGCSFQTKAK